MQVLRRFKTDQSGATAMLFGLALVPLAGAVGSALDYSRAANFHSQAQLAVDAAALALVREPDSAKKNDIQAQGERFVTNALANSLDGRRGITLGHVTATRVGTTVTVSLDGTVKSSILQVVGIPTMAVSAQSKATWGRGATTSKIELALVLDNTGSMNETIGGKRKMDELQSAAKSMLAKLRDLADTPDKVKVSIVPFDTEVRLDAAANRSQPWFRWKNEGKDRPAWTGYVYERYNGYAISDAAPGSDDDSRFPAPADTEYRGDRRLLTNDLPALRPLASLSSYADYQAIDRVIGAMTPRGNTNIALGVTWGMATLSQGAPFTEGVAKGTADVKKIMIVLTDGTNTMSRVNGRQTDDLDTMNVRTTAACTMAKREGVEVYTIRLLAGDENLLRGCASDSGKYFNVQQAGELNAVLDSILGAIAGTRITS